MILSLKLLCKCKMSDVTVILISAGVGILTLILSRIRCRYVQAENADGTYSYFSGCGFTDVPLADQNPTQIDPTQGNVLVFRK